MSNINNYKLEKSQIIEKICSVKNKLAELSNIGVDISETLVKLDNAIDILKKDKLSVVLIGAFSDGKTSVASGWINEKLDNMKISSDESSNEILCYAPTSFPTDCQIVDTPGLFGDKVGNDDKGMQIALSDITKNYISEANLILYVVSAKNPLKDSHKDCVKWILGDLNKASSIIFVINRMDDVADLTDEEDFLRQSQIKIENLRNKLFDFGVNSDIVSTTKVVCISAAPNGKGVDDWKSYRDEYLRRSRLLELDNLTNSILQNSKTELINKTGCDILNDELNKILKNLSQQKENINNTILPEMEEGLKRNKKDLEALYKRLMRSRKDIKSSIKTLQKSKINHIRATTLENFREVMEDEIGITEGKEGFVLNDEINDIFQEYLDKHSDWAKQVAGNFQAEYDKQNAVVDQLLKKGIGGASLGLKGAGQLGVNTFKNGIFIGRDLLGKMGLVIKFKPWQVTKMATFATKALPVIGAAIDVVSNVAENIALQEKNKKFKKTIDQIKDQINDVFYEVIESLNSEEKFINDFAPQYIILKEQIDQDELNIRQQKELVSQFKNWSKDINNSELVIK